MRIKSIIIFVEIKKVTSITMFQITHLLLEKKIFYFGKQGRQRVFSTHSTHLYCKGIVHMLYVNILPILVTHFCALFHVPNVNTPSISIKAVNVEHEQFMFQFIVSVILTHERPLFLSFRWLHFKCEWMISRIFPWTNSSFNFWNFTK